MIEEWLIVPGYEGYYEISSLGRVYSLPRWIKNGVYSYRFIVGHIMHACSDGWGYLHVSFRKNGKIKSHHVHKLVANSFLGNTPIGKEVNHIDGIKTHNWVTNLEYLTRSENKKHAYQLGLCNEYGERNPFHKLTEQEVIAIRQDNRVQTKIALDYRVSQANISAIKRGKTWNYLSLV